MEKGMARSCRAAGAAAARSLAAAAVVALLLGAGGTADAADAPPADVRGAISVDEAVRVALARNFDLLSTEQSVRAAGGRTRQAWQGYLPSLTSRVNYSHNYDNVQQAFGVDFVSPAESYTTSLTLSQTLLDWGAIKDIQAASRSHAASEYSYVFARSDLVLAVKQQYYTLLQAQLLSDVADSALVLARQELRRVQSLFDLGMVARGDVLKAQVRVSQSQLDLISQRGSVVNERARLARLLGQNPSDDLVASEDIREATVAVDSAAVFEEAVRNRPDLLAAQAGWRAAEAAVGSARAGYYPTVTGSYSSALTGYNKYAPSEGEFINTLGITVNFPLFEGWFGKSGQLMQSRAQAEQARYAYQQKRLDVEVEVREAVNAARQANEGVAVARDGLASAEEDLKLSQEKYNVGSGTILDLIDSQVALQRARSSLVTALTQARVAEAQIERVRGIRF
jgi:outer membrane protein TolC